MWNVLAKTHLEYQDQYPLFYFTANKNILLNEDD